MNETKYIKKKERERLYKYCLYEQGGSLSLPRCYIHDEKLFLKTISKPVCIFKAKKVMPLEGKTNLTHLIK